MARPKSSAVAPHVGAAGAIRYVSISNYLGVDLFEAELPAGGAVIAGRNGSGKSSVLKAVKAALEAEGVSPEAIHVGTAKSEIRIDLTDVSVRRVITVDPHTTHMLRSVFPKLADGYDVEVQSYLEVLAERELPARPAAVREVVVHDSCVYAR